MSDLISRSALIYEIKKRSKYYFEDWDSFRKYGGGRAEESYAHFKEDETIINIVNNLPAVEPVRVIHCKDCDLLHTCRYAQYLGLDGYCSNAEKGGVI